MCQTTLTIFVCAINPLGVYRAYPLAMQSSNYGVVVKVVDATAVISKGIRHVSLIMKNPDLPRCMSCTYVFIGRHEGGPVFPFRTPRLSCPTRRTIDRFSRYFFQPTTESVATRMPEGNGNTLFLHAPFSLCGVSLTLRNCSIADGQISINPRCSHAWVRWQSINVDVALHPPPSKRASFATTAVADVISTQQVLTSVVQLTRRTPSLVTGQQSVYPKE